ncbi:MAG TPA: hypothetical protein VJ203_06260 [Bacteroidales bacterium]|nr:hypothetical protein [Bacteroidales bacterium]
MKFKTVIATAGLFTLSLFACELYGQEPTEMSKHDRERMDSLKKVDIQVQEQQRADNKEAMDNAKDANAQSKAKAKEAQRIEQDATNASRESRKALNMEKKAQKARRNADSQTQKASDARDKSDEN